LEPIDEQVIALMRGSEFGDPQIKAMMTQELRQRLVEANSEGRPLQVYCGYDVTAPDIHLGHTITIRKLRQFQDFGHYVTFLIGTFTTLIGDPSDRDDERSIPLKEEIERHAQTYAEQAFKILDPKKTSVRFNHEWLGKLTFTDIIQIASNFTMQQFLTRDRLRNRYEMNKPLWLHELLYSLAQGYDAVFLHADVQIGATEQLFNLMAGRKLQEVFGQKPQVCITFPVLIGTDGSRRMSKSLGNYIGVAEPPDQIYGKVMSIPDSLIIQYFELVTDVSDEELEEFKKELDDKNANPMALKKRLAGEIVSQLYDRKAASEAEAHFVRVVQKKEAPEEIPEYRISFKQLTSQRDGGTGIDISRLLVATELAESRSEANRLIAQGAVSIDGEKISSNIASVQSGSIIKVGKRRFAKVINSDTLK